LEHLLLLAQNGLSACCPSSPHQNVRPFLALIGTRGSGKTQTFSRTIASMVTVASVGVDTEQKTIWNAKLLSKLGEEKEELMMASACHGYGYTHGFHTGLAAGTGTGTRLPTR
jgi:Ni2+-binding GTPase involved in maturation of urease and hydrogenase